MHQQYLFACGAPQAK